ncbi:MAG TPA: hypothetical protein VHG92_06805 [Afifellaceae bacterium]|nr:hypothetical protein [Afifellaceae bacterium]
MRHDTDAKFTMIAETLQATGDEDFLNLLNRENLRGLLLLQTADIEKFERMLRHFKAKGEDVRPLRGAVSRLAKEEPVALRRGGDEVPDAKAVLQGIVGSAELRRDRRGLPYATVTVEAADGSVHREHLNINGQAFADWIGRQFWKATGEALGDRALKDTVALARARALYDGDQHTTWIRVGEADGKIYLDLADEDWTIIEVDAEGWRVADDPCGLPCRFRRTGDELPLPRPVRADRQAIIARLQKLINLKRPEDVVLLLGWMVAALRPGRPCCILLLICEPGSAKTSALRIVCSVTDPRVGQESDIPPSGWDIAVISYNVWIVSWDNVGLLSPEVADSCCRITTGGGARKRALYTDEGSHAIDMCRPLVMTGLRMPSARSDFVDRSLVVDLGIITDETRRTEVEVRAELEALRPALLGLLLDGVSAGLRNDEATRQRLTRLPRMADFMTWVEAAGEAYGWRPGEFQSAYDAAYEVRMAEAAADDALLAAIADFVRHRCAEHPDSRGRFVGKAGELREALKKHLEKSQRTNDYGTPVGRSPADANWFPDRPNGLAVQLQNNRKPLKALGILWRSESDPHSRTAGRVHHLELTDEAAAEVVRDTKTMAAARARQTQREEQERLWEEVVGR